MRRPVESLHWILLSLAAAAMPGCAPPHDDPPPEERASSPAARTPLEDEVVERELRAFARQPLVALVEAEDSARERRRVSVDGAENDMVFVVADVRLIEWIHAPGHAARESLRVVQPDSFHAIRLDPGRTALLGLVPDGDEYRVRASSPVRDDVVTDAGVLVSEIAKLMEVRRESR
jgi:hypothetical protein